MTRNKKGLSHAETLMGRVMKEFGDEGVEGTERVGRGQVLGHVQGNLCLHWLTRFA